MADFLNYFVIPKDELGQGLAEKSQKMVILALPGMFLRLVNDHIKVFIQNQDESLIRKLGVRNMTLYAFSVPLGYLVVVYFKFEEASLGIIIFIYEAICLLICYKMIKQDINAETKDTSLGIFHEFWYFTKQSVKNFIVDYPAFLAVDGENYVASLAGGKIPAEINAQVSIHGLFFNIGSVFYTFFIGFLVLMRTTVNHKIGEKKFKEAKDYFIKYERLIMFVQILALLMLCLVHLFILRPFDIYEDKLMLSWADKVFFFYFFNSADLGIEALYNNIIRTFQKQNLLVWLQFAHFFEIFLSWLIAVKLGKGVLGIGMALCIRQIVIQIIKRWVICKSDWEHIKSYEKEEVKNLPGIEDNKIEMSSTETRVDEDVFEI